MQLNSCAESRCHFHSTRTHVNVLQFLFLSLKQKCQMLYAKYSHVLWRISNGLVAQRKKCNGFISVFYSFTYDPNTCEQCNPMQPDAMQCTVRCG